MLGIDELPKLLYLSFGVGSQKIKEEIIVINNNVEQNMSEINSVGWPL